MSKRGRPPIEYDAKAFADLVGLGCDQKDICWFFRDETGRCANIDTLSRWCKRTFGQNFQEFYAENGGAAMRIRLRRNQLKLSEKSAAMAIFLGKNYLGQTDRQEIVHGNAGQLADLIDGLKEPVYDLHAEAAGVDGAVENESPEAN